MTKLLATIIFLLLSPVFAVKCTKGFGPHIHQNAYDCCIYLGGKPSVVLVGCTYGTCRKLTCDLPQQNADKWDCYSGFYGTLSECTSPQILMKNCEKTFNKGTKCPFTKSVENM